MTKLVELQAVTKRYDFGARPALDSVTLTVNSGGVVGLVGPDGAGKTTLLRLVSGLLTPDAGQMTILGLDPSGASGALRESVGYMPQRFGLYEDLTVLENLELYSDLRGISGHERPRRFAQLLDFTGLERFSERLAGRLSGGMKQKLGLACAMITEPRLLLLDEPSVGVDPISRRELWRMVYDLVDQGIGIVWSTAYLDEAEQCAEVILLSEGQVLHQGAPHEMTRRVENRTFLVKGLDRDRRNILEKILFLPEIADGTIQGESLRLVTRAATGPPAITDIVRTGGAAIVPVAPRFEDAFIDLLGGIAKKSSPFAGRRTGAGSGENVVTAEHLGRRFGDFVAADDITFTVRRGQIFGLIGPNGAGKSTTFKMLNGLLKPSSGSARVAGSDLGQTPAKARAHLGYMAQRFSLYGDLSVIQNIRFFAGIYGLTGKRRKQAIDRMIDAFALSDYLQTDAGALPLGYRQRLSLACAVMHEPDVLFLDEPTSGVDPRTRREFWSHINAMAESGVTVMVTTHFLDEAEYCDRIALIYRGKMIANDSPDELKSRVKTTEQPDPTLEDAFVSLVEAEDLRKRLAG